MRNGSGRYGKRPGQVGQVTYGVCYNVGEGEFDIWMALRFLTVPAFLKSWSNLGSLRSDMLGSPMLNTSQRSRVRLNQSARNVPTAAYEPTGTPAFFERYENYNPETETGDIEISVLVTSR